VSALVYLLFAKEFPEDFELFNITFALPLFANQAVKDALGNWPEGGQNVEKNMFHLVKSNDIVPSLLFINQTYSHLGATIKLLLNMPASAIQNQLPENLRQIDVDKLLKELHRRKNEDLSLFHGVSDFFIPMVSILGVESLDILCKAFPGVLKQTFLV
jgi:hypothetical protein